jgi:hypothetical protein
MLTLAKTATEREDQTFRVPEMLQWIGGGLRPALGYFSDPLWRFQDEEPDKGNPKTQAQVKSSWRDIHTIAVITSRRKGREGREVLGAPVKKVGRDPED